MFDIKEYYDSDSRPRSARPDIVNIDDDLAFDINALLSSRFDSLYRRDRYKHGDAIIEIIHPGLQYPGNNSLLMNPDRVRYLLSFYPNKADFYNIEKIVIRPRFIEIGNIELVGLYLRKKKILVLYLFHPHFYQMRYAGRDGSDEFSGPDMDMVLNDRLTDDIVRREDSQDVHVHPLWYLLSVIRHGPGDTIDKFLIKKAAVNDSVYEALNDISLYYSRHGY